MGHLLIQKDDVWNIWSTVVDAPLYERGMTREELTEVIRYEHGAAGVRELGPRIARALKTGCSHIGGWTLEECIECNRAGPRESRLSLEDLIAQYLSAPAPEAAPGAGAPDTADDASPAANPGGSKNKPA